MKILMVVNWYTPMKEETLTAGVFHFEQAMEFNKYADVRLYWPFEEDVRELVLNNENGLDTYRSGGGANKSKIQWFTYTKSCLENIIKDFSPDLIQANVAYPAGLVAVLCARKHKIPVVLTEHAPIEAMHIDRIRYRWVRNYVYKKTDANICVSKDSMTRLKEIFPKRSFQVIYNSVIDPNGIKDDGNTYAVNGYINCAIVATFYDKEVKGYQYLIPAIKKLKDQDFKIKLHICGGGQYLEFYRNLAKELNVEEECIFYGQCNRQKVYSIVKQVDFCISSSVYECSGVSVQEEMLLGKPILVTKSGGANSLTTKDTAIVVDRNSVDALVDGVIQMQEQLADFNEKIIKEYAFTNFEISNVTKKYMDLFKSILGEVKC